MVFGCCCCCCCCHHSTSSGYMMSMQSVFYFFAGFVCFMPDFQILYVYFMLFFSFCVQYYKFGKKCTIYKAPICRKQSNNVHNNSLKHEILFFDFVEFSYFSVFFYDYFPCFSYFSFMCVLFLCIVFVFKSGNIKKKW